MVKRTYGCAGFIRVIFRREERWNGTQPGRQEGARSGSGRSGSESPVGRGRRVPRADGRTDDRAACQGEEVRACTCVWSRTRWHARRSPARRSSLWDRSSRGLWYSRFSKDDPGAAARVVKDFAKANEKLVATLVSLGGQVLPAKELERVASLPTREQALSMLLGVLKAPIQKFVATLAAAAGQARPYRRRGSRPETGRGRLTPTCLEINFGDSTWLSAKTKSSMQFPR